MQKFFDPFHVPLRPDRPVGRYHVHPCSHPLEGLRQNIPGYGGPGNENPLPLQLMPTHPFDQGLGDILLRNEIDPDTQPRDLLGGPGPDRAELDPLKRPNVLTGRLKPLEKIDNAVHAGEDQPLVGLQPVNRAIQGLPGFGGGHLNRRELDRVRPIELEEVAEFLRLVPGACDQDPLSEKRPAFKPIQFFPQAHHLPHDDQDRRL